MSASVKCSFLLSSLSIIVLALASAIAVRAQSNIDDVHVNPHVKAEPGARIDLDPSLVTNTPPIKKDVDLVLVPVTITDEQDRIITGLDKDNFQVFEGKDPEEIRHFSSDDSPVSVGFILDLSGSMQSKLDRAREAIVEFCRTANPQDEFFLIEFSDRPQVVADFTHRVEDIQNQLILTAPQGHTALLDAVFLGVQTMKQASHRKRALLIISDGGDNHSRYTEREVTSLVKEADVMIYAVGVYDRYFATPEERMGPELLNEISEVTGGRAFTIDNPNSLPEVANKIGMELRYQYLLAYRPNKKLNDGKWRKIKVKLRLPHGFPRLQVRARSGYYMSLR
jgi:Ca-activated chloride channel family protein